VSIDNALHLVEQRLVNAFLSELPAGIYLENTIAPNGTFHGGATPKNKPWARISPAMCFGPISTDASGCYEINEGRLIISLFWPRGSGSIAAMSAAHQVKELFHRPNYDDVIIPSVVVSPTPEPESSNWFGVNITINFQYEGFRS
jgi:hypothetical protein